MSFEGAFNSNLIATQQFRDDIEIKYLRKHSIFVNWIIGLMILPVLFYLRAYQVPNLSLLYYGIFFFILFSINLAFFAYEDYFNSLKLAMYITALGLYVVITSLIIQIQTPSMYTGIFIAYAIISLYQDAKVTTINNVALFFVGILAISQYQSIFELQSSFELSSIYIYVFLVIFVLLISLASRTFIKRKLKFFEKLAEIQETEIRTLETLFKLKKKYKENSFNTKHYYSAINKFTEEFTKDYEITNVFKDKIKIIKDLNTMKIRQVSEKYLNYTLEEITALSKLRLGINDKLTYLAFKMGMSENYEISKKEIFSETKFNSLKHYNDDLYTRIIAFSAFYVSLRVDKPFLNGLSDQEIKNFIENTEFFYMIDSRVRDIYLNNYEVFDKIFQDSYGKGNI